MAGVYDNTFEAGVRCLAERLHQHDCRLFIHLFHIGRNHADDILGRPLLAPSAVPSPIYRHMPKEMTAEDIKRVKEDFADAAARCRAWGADGVAVNCSAGYLLSLFLSGETNQRTDEYGGSQENRFRFPLEVLARVREAVGRDFPVLVKISGSSMRTRGYGLKDMEAFSSKLSGLADAIGVTGGWHEAPVPQITYQVPRGFYSCLSSCIKEHSGLPVICYNRINDRETAERILEEEKADLVACGRPFLADAGFAAKIRDGHPYHPCVGCNRGCMDRVIRNQEVRCIQNPELGSEYQKLSSLPAKEGRVLVIGGGVAGQRQLEDGYEVIRVQTPCFLTAVKELNKPRYMTMKGIYEAYDKEITVWGFGDVDVPQEKVGLKSSPTRVFRSFTPAPKGAGTVLGGTPKEQVAALMGCLKEKHII